MKRFILYCIAVFLAISEVILYFPEPLHIVSNHKSNDEPTLQRLYYYCVKEEWPWEDIDKYRREHGDIYRGKTEGRFM